MQVLYFLQPLAWQSLFIVFVKTFLWCLVSPAFFQIYMGINFDNENEGDITEDGIMKIYII